MTPSGRALIVATLAAAIAGLVTPVRAQSSQNQSSQNPSYPNRPIRILNGFSGGGGSDALLHVMAPKLSERLGQPVVVELRSGASGMVANDAVAKAPPDGYLLVLLTGAFMTQAAVEKKLPYDPVRDFAMLSTVTYHPFVVTVIPQSPFGTLADFIAFAKAHPGTLNYGSVGIGSLHHLASELFSAMTGIDMVHVPFRGSAALETDLRGARIDVVFTSMPSMLPKIRDGSFRPLAITVPAGSPFLPDVPPVSATAPGYDVTSFFGLVTTARTPSAVTERLNQEIRRVLDVPDIRQRFFDQGVEPQPSTPEEMRVYVEGQIANWKKVVEERKIEVQ